MRRTLSILVENRPGELSRVLGVFTGRGQSIESLSVAETLDSTLLRITLVTTAQEHAIHQIVKRIERQVRVLEVVDLTERASAERELALVRLDVELSPVLLEVLNLVAANRLRLIDACPGHVTLEATGDWKTVQEIAGRVSALGACAVRSGAIAIADAQVGSLDEKKLECNFIPAPPSKGEEKKCESITTATQI